MSSLSAASAPSAVVIVPGLGGSGPDHWQSHLAQDLNAPRVEQANWDQPTPDAWTAGLSRTVQEQSQPVVLVAHSLGCILSARWCLADPQRARQAVRGVVLVAPADVDSPHHTPDAVRGFAPIPTQRLPVPAVVVASRNDPYCTFARAAHFASAWGADLLDLGEAGHINVAAGYGRWPLVFDLVARFSLVEQAV